MYRNAMKQLLVWKQNCERKPLLVYGARQTGKSYLIRHFGHDEFNDMAYFDLEANAAARSAFDGDIEPKTILRKLGQVQGKPIDPGKTLVVLDEIQASNRALASLKYFNEGLPGSFVIAAGSLLGVAVKREGFSAPVGKVETMTLRPMSFDEFLLALGDETMRDDIQAQYRLSEQYVRHDDALDRYWAYLLCGGMPEAVAAYVADNHDFGEIRTIQRNILDLYVADMAKYALPTETARIREAFNSIPAQLAKENHKFQYKIVHSGGRASQYAFALDWLETAGLASRCVQITSGQLPLALHENRSAFKIYMADTGLLGAMSELPVETLLNPQLRGSLDLGAFTENYVAQTLTASGHTLRYWTSKSDAEVNFVAALGDQATLRTATPIEVKSSDNVRSRSLRAYQDKYQPQRLIRLSTKNFGREKDIESVPLYAAFCL
ncbi:ATP-binding protein [Bifidobacterium sp. ESL0784]|uniref:ATP-binding protein n=1 Tax=Bifidobacterium sp. ESL0784 TaxID=2983231 RepID=UPI0023F6EDAE|nr:ATP-binding protein [Bifidobacterium sp. ESL0784]MDF7640833.1 ATP-binding protein [Bifidobacterium sp. ESL0784]